MGAKLAGRATFGATLQHIDEVQAVKQGQRAAERTEEPAIGPLGEKPDRQQEAGIDLVRQGRVNIEVIAVLKGSTRRPLMRLPATQRPTPGPGRPSHT